jgi:PleD family two-component response regulator
MKRVLIIDDDQTVIDDLRESFNESEIETIICLDRDIALQAINDDVPFDAVILD